MGACGGKVLVAGEKWDLSQNGVPLSGAGRVTSGSALQIGSYFGASLLTVDVDRDGSSDLVLIGAPHYYKPTQGGQVSVCPFPQGVSV